MRFRLKRHEKGLLPAWVWVGVGLAAAAAIGLAFQALPARIVPPCGFRLVTGHPCPSCGATRMGGLLLRGRAGEAILMNPFLFLLAAGLGLWVVAGLVARLLCRDLLVEVPAGQERWFWWALLVAFLANWAYLWHAGI